MSSYINLTLENLNEEHLCCAISDKKHQCGVLGKKAWLAERLPEGHVFRKLDVRGKVFIEYAPLKTAWVPIEGENYIYIHCLWVSGSHKNNGYGKELLEYCILDAKARGSSGVCVISSRKKSPFLSDRRFLEKYGFEVVDSIDDYELLALPFDESRPSFTERARKQEIEEKELTLYYSPQCPYIMNCILKIRNFTQKSSIPLKLIEIDSLDKAKAVPGVFNNWAVFYKGKFRTVHLLDEGHLIKLILEH